jgi:hypothetical protein
MFPATVRSVALQMQEGLHVVSGVPNFRLDPTVCSVTARTSASIPPVPEIARGVGPQGNHVLCPLVTKRGMEADEHATPVSVLELVFAANRVMFCSCETRQDTIVEAAEPEMSETTSWMTGQAGKRSKDSQGPNLTCR